MPRRIILTVFFIVTLLTTSVYGVSHKFSVSVASLIRNSAVSQISTLSTNGNWYAVDIENWRVDGTVFGLGVDFAYEATFKNNFFLRVATGIESTGGFYWPIDIGGGVKVNIANGIKLNIGVYLATVQTGGKLEIVPSSLGVVGLDPPEDISYYLGMFGFKGRIMLEIPINRKYTLSPFIAYAAYPHATHSINVALDNEIFINNLSQGLRLDGIQVGVEFGYIL